MNEAIVAVIALILGAILQYSFTRLDKRHDYKNKILTEACIEYFTAISNLKFKTKEQISNINNYMKAKEKILLYGSIRIVNLLYNFEKTDKILNNYETIDALSDLLIEMRVNVFHESTLNKKTIKKILFDI